MVGARKTRVQRALHDSDRAPAGRPLAWFGVSGDRPLVAIVGFSLVISMAGLQPLQAIPQPAPGLAFRPDLELGAPRYGVGYRADRLDRCLSQLTPDALDLDPVILNQSPVLQRWLQAIPDVDAEITRQPAFRPRVRAAYTGFPARGETGGVEVGVEDIFLLPGTGLTLSSHYSTNSNGQRQSYGVEARYYLLPLGNYLNLAPTLGYRDLASPDYRTGGVELGLRLMLVTSRGGGADLALSQQWVSLGQPGETSITGFNLGYAVSSQLRLATDLEFQSSPLGYDSRWGLGLEWLL